MCVLPFDCRRWRRLAALLVLLLGAIMAFLEPAGAAGPPAAGAVERTPAWLREHGNHLLDEPSLYLRQHAHNPVDWYPWGEEALARARALDRPVFLSIGYSSCHWCHVMEHEVFEDDAVAAFLNDHFVCIKVDREQRPDLDAVYMDAVVAMTGRGGWPLSVFLTPDLEPFFGGTYFPRDRFLDLVTGIAAAYRERRDDLVEQARRVAAHVARAPRADGREAPTRGGLDRIVADALARVDREHGGFAGRQKFPTPLRWRFLLHRWRRAGGRELERSLRRTLDAMAAGGIHDHLGGGFHRYTVEPTWTVPHFEIMLYDNAQLASLYLEAAAALDEPRYREVATGILDFLLREMQDPDGGFFASLDADSGGEEGSYYVWTPGQITAVCGERDGPPLAMLLGVTARGNFEGRSVLTRRVPAAAVARRFGRSEEEIAGLFDRWREPLREARARRVPPGVDGKIVTAWNGLAIQALARAYGATGDDRYREAAERAAARLWQLHRDGEGRLWRTSDGGRPAGAGTLDDVADLAEGLLDLFQATGELRWFTRARELLAVAERDFADPGVGYFRTAAHVPAPLGRRADLLDSVEPSGFSALLHAQLRAAALAGDRALRARAERWLTAYGDLVRRAGLEAAWWADAADLLVGPSLDVVIAGDGEQAAAMRRAFWSLDPFHAVVVSVPSAGPDAATAAVLPTTAGRTAPAGEARAYVCRFGACGLPAVTAAELRRQLVEGLAVPPPPP